LFHTNRIIAAYIPSRKVVTHPAILDSRKVRHVARWRQELRVEMHPDSDFFSNILAEAAYKMHELDRTHFPSRGA
jgi:hypothetical protein